MWNVVKAPYPKGKTNEPHKLKSYIQILDNPDLNMFTALIKQKFKTHVAILVLK